MSTVLYCTIIGISISFLFVFLWGTRESLSFHKLAWITWSINQRDSINWRYTVYLFPFSLEHMPRRANTRCSFEETASSIRLKEKKFLFFSFKRISKEGFRWCSACRNDKWAYEYCSRHVVAALSPGSFRLPAVAMVTREVISLFASASCANLRVIALFEICVSSPSASPFSTHCVIVVY